ncbi:hypothetical protein [Streptomyces crystallinus]|uniref:Gram-positive cocci surface proteins LPxTG domain-containing protein n=1 Tax=Streptomyces crystallinus TaxID=68191 RepID=A0ABN1GKV1_9ACTN
MHFRRTVLVVAAGVMAPTAVLGAAPALAVGSPPTALTLPEPSSDDGKEEREPEGKNERAGGGDDADEGVTVSVRGVPQAFTAGGPWQELTLAVDAQPSEGAREVTFMIVDGAAELNSQHVDVQVRGASEWQDLDPAFGGSTAHYALAVPAGTTEVSIRLRFHADAPLVGFHIGASDGISYDSPWYESRITRATEPGDPGGGEPTDPGTEEPTDPGGQDPTDPGDDGPGDPGSEQPTDPGAEAGAGSPGGTAGTEAGQTGTDGQPQAPEADPATAEGAASGGVGRPADDPTGALAETGLDAATRWQLGVGGTAIALGTALCLYRRRTAA